MAKKKFFADLNKSYNSSAVGRRQLGEISSQVQFLSKQAIFAAHRGEVAVALRLLLKSERHLKTGQKLINQIQDLEYQGSYRAALEEFVEASLFYNYLESGQVSALTILRVPTEIYIGALSDFVGELVRYAVKLATIGQGDRVGKIVAAATEIVSELARMNLTGALRGKFDQARQHLRKLEDIQYDLAVKRHV